MKVAVVLFNLGGPDSKESIKPFLFNFFMDKNIVRLPWLFRFLLAKYISIKRSKREAGRSYHELGNVSPLLENSRAQAKALEKYLNTSSRRKPGSADQKAQDPAFQQADDVEYKTFVSMRYWHPDALDVIPDIEKYKPDRLVLLPLYPQFSTTTTNSSFQDFWRSVQHDDGWLHAEWDEDVKVSWICCYPFNEGFINASIDQIQSTYAQAQKDGHPNIRLLFSAHGLPESVIRHGDPYQWQCEQSAAKIAEKLGIPNLDWAICYQSRVGAQKWIGPSTEDELQRAARDHKTVIIYPHAFTQEHVETLVEIELEYRELAHELGIEGFYRVPTVSTHPSFIEGLADMVRTRLNDTEIKADGGQRICPVGFRRCCMGTAA